MSFKRFRPTQKLNKIAEGDPLVIQGNTESGGELARSSDENSPKPKYPHCSHWASGQQKAHLKFSCEYCGSNAGKSCWQKSVGCDCSSCDFSRKVNENKNK